MSEIQKPLCGKTMGAEVDGGHATLCPRVESETSDCTCGADPVRDRYRNAHLYASLTARYAAPSPEGVVLTPLEKDALNWEHDRQERYALVERIIARHIAAERAAHEGLVGLVERTADENRNARTKQDRDYAVRLDVLARRLRAALAAGVRGE